MHDVRFSEIMILSVLGFSTLKPFGDLDRRGTPRYADNAIIIQYDDIVVAVKQKVSQKKNKSKSSPQSDMEIHPTMKLEDSPVNADILPKSDFESP